MIQEILLIDLLKKEIDFFDIVDRPKSCRKQNIKKQISNKVILVTGGRSIGSELCLEIVKHKPKKLFILNI